MGSIHCEMNRFNRPGIPAIAYHPGVHAFCPVKRLGLVLLWSYSNKLISQPRFFYGVAKFIYFIYNSE